MKILRIHLIELAAAVLFVVLAILFCQGGRKAADEDIFFDQDWSYVTEDGIQEYGRLPEMIHLPPGEDTIILKKQLSADISSADAIGFYTSHQLAEVFVSGEKVFERKVPAGSRSKTPGNCWNFVQLQEEYAGKTLEVRLTSCYSSAYVKIPLFFCGTQSGILYDRVKDKFVSLFMSFLLFAMGTFLVASWFLVGKKMRFHQGIPWLGLFTIYFAIWSCFESQIPVILFGRELLCSQITFISLKLMPLPLIYFVQVIYNKKSSRLLNIFAWISVVEFGFSFLAQLMGWFDLRQTLWMTHLLGVLIAITVVALGIQALRKREKSLIKDDGKFWINVICICAICVCAVLDGFNYYYGFYNDVAYFSRIGCLVYVFVLSKRFLDDSMKLIRAGQQAEAIMEEAELDGLTCLKNRKSFEHDLSQINKGEFRKYGVVMFDLNNLKRMNDLYGHGMGDCYIITGSEIIRDVFGELGEIYRIGGDEFCLISNMISEEVYREKSKRMCDWLASLRGTQVRDFMQIASGFAKYNRNMDFNLQDTIGRADERMYQCKREQKAAQRGGN